MITQRLELFILLYGVFILLLEVMIRYGIDMVSKEEDRYDNRYDINKRK